MQKTPKNWYVIGGILAAWLCVTSLIYDYYPQFPSMCMILGIFLAILLDDIDTLPPLHTYEWGRLRTEVQAKITPLWKALLLVQAKILFPTIFTVYLLLLIAQKIKVVPSDFRIFATSTIDNLELLWVTLVSAVLTNFTGVDEKSYEVKKDSPVGNIFTLIFVCLLSYAGMWAIFAEIASIGRIAYFVSLAVGILIALVSVMILTENEDEVV